MDKSKLIIVGIAVVAISVGVYLYFSKPEKPKNPVEQIEEAVTQNVPEIKTNPVENKVPELNPVDKANPFKYNNPLR